ncbi:MAG: acetyl-CoA hydrolase [Deltaproteobacteria bacterium]|nr:MAG: acetyl-CoA hydrolase [Deltaproteobacteria bacterium]
MSSKDWLYSYCPEKVCSAEEALQHVKRGNRVFLGTGCGEPQHLIRTMVGAPGLHDILLYQMLSYTLAEFVDDPNFTRNFSLKLFFVTSVMRKAAFEGKIDYIPAYLSQIPRLFRHGQIGLDVALVQVSPPDTFGYCSLGVSVDITKAGMESADIVIAQVNENMPRTWGNTTVHVDDIDYFVLKDEPLITGTPEAFDPHILERIGMYVSQLVDDGATIQIGFGRLPHGIVGYLNQKNDLGVHTQLVTEGFLPLFKDKVITNRRKTLLRGKTVASLCMGGQNLYDYVNDNPQFEFRPSGFVSDPTMIALNDNMTAISSALEVDLTGQVCMDSLGYMFYSGIGDQVDFLRGSAMSKGGFSIIALPSTARGGSLSRIVPNLSPGAGVATTRGDVNFVVTEYGIAELQGKSIYQRVMELSQIAHPDFREELVEVAKERHYIFADQLPPSTDDLLFVEEYKSMYEMRDGKVVKFRALLPSDEFAFRNFFYSLQEQTVYNRFFRRIKLFSHELAQQQWADLDYHDNVSLVGMARIKGHREIVAIGSYAKAEDGYAEVAFVVREDFQNKGIASYLIARLAEIAKKNGFIGFKAIVLDTNASMLHLFRKVYPNASYELLPNKHYDIVMDFDGNPPKELES